MLLGFPSTSFTVLFILIIYQPQGEHSDIRHTGMTIRYFWVKCFWQLLRSHYRNYGEHKGLAVLNSELSTPSILSVTLRNYRQGFSTKSCQYFKHYISPFVGYWHRAENQEISLIKTIEHLSKAANNLFS